MASTCVFIKISGLPEHIIVERLEIEEQFSSPVLGFFVLHSAYSITFHEILKARIRVEINAGYRLNATRYFHGIITEYSLNRVKFIDKPYVYHIKFASFIWYLKKEKYFRVFPHKMLSEVIDFLLKPYLAGINCEVHIQNKIKRNYLQYDVTDFDFFHQLLEKYNLVYFFKGFETIETMIITDDFHYRSEKKSSSSCFDKQKPFFSWKEEICYNRSPCVTVASDHFHLRVGAVFQIENHKPWVVQRITHKMDHFCIIDIEKNLLTAHYSNKFYAIEKKYIPLIRGGKYKRSDFIGIEKAVVIDPHAEGLEVVCPRSQNKQPIIFTHSEVRSGNHLSMNFTPQKGQIVFISFQDITRGIILGGLFKPHHAFPFDMDAEGISISTEITKQQIQLNKTGICIYSSSDVKQLACGDIAFSVKGKSIIAARKTIKYRVFQGNFSMKARSIRLCVGDSCIQLNENDISLMSKEILIN